MPNQLPSIDLIEAAQKENPWNHGNSILYQLCKDNINHTERDEILTKVLFIGRIYAAAVERRKNKSTTNNDDFYIDIVAPAFLESNLDTKIAGIKGLRKPETTTIKRMLETHYHLTELLKKITKQNKRSFSSKYLHFHLPELFYIYDSRAETALRQFVSYVPKDLKSIPNHANVDNQYAKFYCKCFELKRLIKSDYNIELSNRQLDNLLIEVANNHDI